MAFFSHQTQQGFRVQLKICRLNIEISFCTQLQSSQVLSNDVDYVINRQSINLNVRSHNKL